MPTYQEHMQALQRAREAGDVEAMQIIRADAVKAMRGEEKARFRQEEAARPRMGRVMSNLGAGFDSAWQGVKQLVGQGPTDEELKDKRRRDEELADTTTGGSLFQLAGEVAPAVALGGGIAGVAGRVLPAAVRAHKAAPLVRGALEGAGAAAMMPVTTDESRLNNALLGAAGGAGVPLAMKGVSWGAGKVGKAGERALAGLPGDTQLAQWAANRGGDRRIGNLLRKNEVRAADVATPTYVPHPDLPTTPSAAVTYNDPKLASLELGSRQQLRDAWMPFDEANQAARWRHLDENLQTGDDVSRLLGEANKIGASVPYASTGPRLFKRNFDDFAAKLEQAKASPQYQGNPTVKSAVDYVTKTISSADEVTPQLVHQMKQTLSRGLTGAPGAGEAGVRAATSEPFVISLSNALDDVLAQSSKGNKWNKWKGDYGEVMTKAESAKADANIRNKFVDEVTGTVKKGVISPMNPGEPVVTGAALKQAVAAAGSAKRGPRKGQELLRKESKAALRNVMQDLDAANILGRVRAASTPGGGSDTAANLGSSAMLGMLDPTLGIGRYLLAEGGDKMNRAAAERLAKILQDPEKLKAFLREQELRRAAPVFQSNLLTRGAGSALALPATD